MLLSLCFCLNFINLTVASVVILFVFLIEFVILVVASVVIFFLSDIVVPLLCVR